MSDIPVYIRVADEIVSTETTFVNQMEVLCLVYINPLRASNILPPSTLASLFSNVETLFAFNSKLLEDLTKDQADNKLSNRNVGKIFKQVSEASERALCDRKWSD